jgi:putative CocE/NonD family hydrolase
MVTPSSPAIALLASALLALSAPAGAQLVKFAPPSEDQAGLAEAMPALAQATIAAYREPDARKRLDTLFRLQMVAGQWADADRTLEALHQLRAAGGSPPDRAANVLYQILVRAKLLQARDSTTLEDGFSRAFREIIEPLDDRTSALVARALAADQYPVGISLHVPIEENLKSALARVRGKGEIPLGDAVALLRAYQVRSAFKAFDAVAPPLVDQEDHRRFVLEERLVRVGDGASVCATIVRPKTSARLPALLEFTIYADPTVALSEERRSASNGYIGVEGFTRGKGCSPDKPVPYEHDGADGAALVDWISRQPWSDGRVATFGPSYTGFVQWAIAKHRPAALKAMMDSVSNAPAIDMPMDGNVFLRFQYPWTFYTSTNKTLDPATYDDQARWSKLFDTWYRTGAAWRALDKIDGTPNPIWDKWLDHPSYDGYWQGLVTYGDDFAHVNVPVLTTTGYFEGAGDGALYYLDQHLRHDPGARHYLVVGPYNHASGNRGTVDVFGDPVEVVDGYPLDPAAQIDIGELRYQWFDYVLKGGPKPAILEDRINYEVMGANVWRHAPSVEAMGPTRLRLHLSSRREGDSYALAPAQGSPGPMPTLTVDLADRSDADRSAPGGSAFDTAIDTYEALVFETRPFIRPVELSGFYSASLDAVTNKKDFDFEIAFYERTRDGRYLQLAYDFERASFVGDRTHRRLLTPGAPRTLKFQASLLTSCRLGPGSRLVMVLSAIKTPLAQINYGTGKDVSDETIADAGAPLTIQWLADSFVDIPLASRP